MGTIRTTITIDEEAYKKLLEKAKEERRTISNYITYIAEKSAGVINQKN